MTDLSDLTPRQIREKYKRPHPRQKILCRIPELGNHYTYIYAVCRPDVPEIKIGASRSPLARMDTLQSAHSVALEMLVCFPSGHLAEADIHAQFAAHRKGGEWFHAAPEIFAWIEEMRRFVDAECPGDLQHQRQFYGNQRKGAP